MNRFEKIAAVVASVRYDELADAGAVTGDSRYGRGSTGVWYMRPNFARNGLMGYDWLVEKGLLPDPRNLSRTHIFLGTVNESNEDKIYRMMQGEAWSPQGEARGMIAKLGLNHTSMSVGDIVEVGGGTLIVDTFGFKEL